MFAPRRFFFAKSPYRIGKIAKARSRIGGKQLVAKLGGLEHGLTRLPPPQKKLAGPALIRCGTRRDVIASVFLQRHMEIGAAKTEGTDAGTPWVVVQAVQPRFRLSVDKERRL